MICHKYSQNRIFKCPVQWWWKCLSLSMGTRIKLPKWRLDLNSLAGVRYRLVDNPYFIKTSSVFPWTTEPPVHVFYFCLQEKFGLLTWFLSSLQFCTKADSPSWKLGTSVTNVVFPSFCENSEWESTSISGAPIFSARLKKCYQTILTL